MKKLIVVLLLFVGCKSNIKTVETTKVDTVRVSKVIKIDKPQLNELIIENVCDSLGNLKIINYTSNSGKLKTSLKSDKNTLKLEVNLDSIKQVWEKEYKSSILDVKEKETIIKKVIPKWVWYSILINILLLVWIFRKPLLRLINPIKL